MKAESSEALGGGWEGERSKGWGGLCQRVKQVSGGRHGMKGKSLVRGRANATREGQGERGKLSQKSMQVGGGRGRVKGAE